MKLAVWYHTRLFGGEPEINSDWSIALMREQMNLLNLSGLLAASKEFTVCVNGDSENQTAARILAPKKASFIDHGKESKGLLRTMNALREWAMNHPDWLVCFWHIKGVTHPHDALCAAWRGCMERAVIQNWRQCVADLTAGFESVGAHWLAKERYGSMVTFPFWGGQFFWARASFLATLPELPNNPTCREDWFKSENWIGMGPRAPKVKDYANHWPGLNNCRA
jgi:hypothetical protein